MAKCPWCGGKRFYRKSKKNEYNVAIYQCLRCKRDFYGDIRKNQLLGLYGPTWRPIDIPPKYYIKSFLADNLPHLYED